MDESGTYATGLASDLDEYVRDFAESYGSPVSRVVHARCAECQGETFSVRIDDDEGYAQRTCSGCAHQHTMFDSADFTDEAEPDDAACPCGSETFSVAGGFALTPSGEVRWVYVALHCVQDGVLGVYADWKIDYEPSTHLFDQV